MTSSACGAVLRIVSRKSVIAALAALGNADRYSSTVRNRFTEAASPFWFSNMLRLPVALRPLLCDSRLSPPARSPASALTLARSASVGPRDERVVDHADEGRDIEDGAAGGPPDRVGVGRHVGEIGR